MHLIRNGSILKLKTAPSGPNPLRDHTHLQPPKSFLRLPHPHNPHRIATITPQKTKSHSSHFISRFRYVSHPIDLRIVKITNACVSASFTRPNQFPAAESFTPHVLAPRNRVPKTLHRAHNNPGVTRRPNFGGGDTNLTKPSQNLSQSTSTRIPSDHGPRGDLQSLSND